jgi:hypothetical protein
MSSSSGNEAGVSDVPIASVKSLSSAFEGRNVADHNKATVKEEIPQGPSSGIAELRNRFAQAQTKSETQRVVEDISVSQSVKNLKEMWQKNTNLSSTMKKEVVSPQRQKVKVANYESAPVMKNYEVELVEKSGAGARDLINQFSAGKVEQTQKSQVVAPEVTISAKEKIKLFASNNAASNFESKKQKVESSEMASAKEKIKLFADDKAASNEVARQSVAVSDNEKGKSKEMAKLFAENKVASTSKSIAEKPQNVAADVPHTKEKIKQFIANASTSSPDQKAEPKEDLHIEVGTKERIKQLISNQSSETQKKEVADLPKPRESGAKKMIRQFSSNSERELNENIRINPAIFKLRNEADYNSSNFDDEYSAAQPEKSVSSHKEKEESTEVSLIQSEAKSENTEQEQRDVEPELPAEKDTTEEPKKDLELETRAVTESAPESSQGEDNLETGEGAEPKKSVSEIREKMKSVPIMGFSQSPARHSVASIDSAGELHHPQLERPLIPSSAGRRPSESLKRTM